LAAQRASGRPTLGDASILQPPSSQSSGAYFRLHVARAIFDHFRVSLDLLSRPELIEPGFGIAYPRLDGLRLDQTRPAYGSFDKGSCQQPAGL
jgi:hypothetical protein